MRIHPMARVAVALLMAVGSACAEVRGVVEVAGEQPIPLAVAPAVGEAALAESATRILEADLDRAHWFARVAWQGPAPADAAALDPARIPPGTGLVASGAVRVDGEEIVLEGFVHAADGTRQMAREYRVPVYGLAAAMHSFADDIVRDLTGAPGLASSTIAYVASHEGRPALFATHPGGDGDRKLVSGRFECLFPRYAPDLRWLVYTAYPRGFPELMLFDPAGPRNVSISARAGMNSLGALAPGGRRLAATLSFEGNPEIYLLGLDGKIERRLTRSRGCDLSPVWSPDGTRIAFVSDRSGSPAIYLMEVAGEGEPQRLTHAFDSSAYCVNPSFSPRGDYLAFAARGPGGMDVMVLRLADRQMFRVTEGGGDEEAPDWAPDNRHLVVAVKQGGASRLEVVDVRDPRNRYTVPLRDRSGVRDPSWCRVLP